MIGGTKNLLEEIFTLTKTVGRIETTMVRVEETLLKHNERLHKLEHSTELTLEKAKTESARQTADMMSQVTRELTNLQHAFKSIDDRVMKTPNHQELLTALNTTDL